MSKKTYKPQKRYGSLKNNSRIVRGAFSMETSKYYVAGVIAVFHILPLIFLAFGETGRMMLTQLCMTLLNPLMIFVIMLIYGIRIGFNFKMPIITTALAALSVAMYYTKVDQEAYIYYTVVSTVIMFVVYGVFSYVSAVIGAFIKSFFE